MKILYVNLSKLEFTDEEYDELMDVSFMGQEFKKIFLPDKNVILAPVNNFMEVKND